ncbi:hypothetical protein TWF281_004228 [Arthrobotrys megalospora]
MRIRNPGQSSWLCLAALALGFGLLSGVADALPQAAATTETSPPSETTTSAPRSAWIPGVNAAEEYEVYRGQNRIIAVSNWDIEGNGKIDPTNVIDNGTQSLEYYKLRRAMKNAIIYFSNLELDDRQNSDRIARLFINQTDEDTVKADLEVGIDGAQSKSYLEDGAQSKETLCTAQQSERSESEDESRKAIVYCDESGYSIRLYDRESKPRGWQCLSIATVAYGLSLRLAVPPGKSDDEQKEWVLTGKKIPASQKRPWEAIGHTFWSEELSWFIYIAKEPRGSCQFKLDPKAYWPAFGGLPADPVQQKLEFAAASRRTLQGVTP